MRSSLSVKSVAAALVLCGGAANADPRPAVIELFTSEGCSSCPPAEAYLAELARRPDVLALSWHVDYWDQLGWRDRFALHDAVTRQYMYARARNRASVYTPQFILDGGADYPGIDRSAIGRALSEKRTGVAVEIAVSGEQLLVSLGRGEQVGRSEVVLVAYLREAVSAIGRGENAGRTLHEYNIVRAIHTLGRWDGEPMSFRTARSSLPPEATDVAVLVHEIGRMLVTGAASRSLE